MTVKEENEEEIRQKFRKSIAAMSTALEPISEEHFSNPTKDQKESIRKIESQYGKVTVAKEEKPREFIAYKYSNNGRCKLHESIILNGYSCFVAYDTDKDKVSIKSNIEEHTRTLRPPNIEECPFPPYEFENQAELNEYIRRAKEIKSGGDLYHASKHFWNMYVDQDTEIVNILAADSILTYFQDLFSVIHYVEAIGGNDVGKSSIGYTMQYIGYRAVKGMSITGANYLRNFGTVEPGQCTIIEDEGDNISDDPDKARILKAGYEYNGKIPRINTNTKNQEQNWYFVYGYKMILTEKSLRQLKAKGLVDRTFTMKCRPGKVNYAIKDVVSEIVNKSPKLDKHYQQLLDFRKLMLCYRLIHYKDELARIKVNLENRDKELAFPLLQLFHGTTAFEEVKEAVELFIKQRHERKSRSLEAALYSIIKSEIYPNGYETSISNNISILFSKIWDRIIAGCEIEGHYDEKRPNEYDTKEYGKLFNRTLSILISDTFSADAKHTNKGSELTFNLEKFKSFKCRYDNKNGIGAVKVEVELESDASDASDDVCYPLGIYCHTNNNRRSEVVWEKKVVDPSRFASPSSLLSHTNLDLESYRLFMAYRGSIFLNQIQSGLRTCQRCGYKADAYWFKHHQCEVHHEMNGEIN